MKGEYGMYTITCARCGKYPRFNRTGKGQFSKQFSTLSDFAMFATKSMSSLYFPNIRQELTRREEKILMKKLECCKKLLKQQNNKVK